MFRAIAKPCASDSDWAKFARFYLKGSGDFHRDYTIHEAAAHIWTTCLHSKAILLQNEAEEVIGTLQYIYEEDTETAFIDSAILHSRYRSSPVFLKGFRAVIGQICRDHPGVESFRFLALESNRYLNRLYGKFAERTGVQDEDGDCRNVYEVKANSLRAYLRID